MDEKVSAARRSFAALVGRRHESVPLAEGALLIAAEEYPGLDVGDYLSRLDVMADSIREAVDNAEDARAAGSILAAFLHDTERFRGVGDDYYDPRNSFLNDVLDRRQGIPITLSIVFIEVARRLGISVSGIGLPGHFLVRLEEAGTYVDPFSGRADLRETDCADLVRTILGGEQRLERSMLAGQTNRRILGRVLRNLREIYRTQNDAPREMAALDRMILLRPQDAGIRRERARLLGTQGEYRRALRDIEEVRRLQPSARRSDRFRGWRTFVRDMAARMN